MPTISPQMNLPIPTIGTDSGLIWEQAVAAALTILDGHNHSSGSGAPVLSTSIAINTDLTFNDNNATLLKSARFQVQTGALAGADDLGCLYVTGDDLYFNDENGNQIQITLGGSVNATSSGISSGNASAGFISTVLVVYSDTPATVPGDISCGSLLLGLNTGSAHRLEISPPASLVGGSYSLVLPAIPASISLVTLDASGNFGTAQAATANIADGAVTSPKIAAGTIQQSNLAILNVTATSYSSFTTTNTVTPQVVTGATMAITLVGSVAAICIDTTLSATNTGAFTLNQGLFFYLYRNGSVIRTWQFQPGVNTSSLYTPFLGTVLDGPGPGTYTYDLRVKALNAQSNSGVTGGFLQVYEL